MALSPNAQAVRNAAGGRHYGLMYLAFATVAYADQSEKDIARVTRDLPAKVATLAPPPVPGADTDWGAWSVDWGPVVFGQDQNLMYIASFRETGLAHPVMTVLAIRGTDVAAGAEGVIGQIFQDVRDWSQVLWKRASGEQTFPCLPDLDPFDRSRPKIAEGTCRGMQRLRAMTAVPAEGTEPATAQQYLQTLLALDPALPVVVTGHSLGGCQATVMAMYLADELPAGTRILANPFAPPTAGNAAFAAMYDRRFPEGNVWWNTLDLVPNAYAKGTPGVPGNLLYAEGLWQGFEGPGNPLFAGTIRTLKGTLPEYAQPVAGSVQLTGSVASQEYVDDWLAHSRPKNAKPPGPWLAQLEWQHFPPNYYWLMSNQVADLAPYAYAGPYLPPNPAPP